MVMAPQAIAPQLPPPPSIPDASLTPLIHTIAQTPQPPVPVEASTQTQNAAHIKAPPDQGVSAAVPVSVLLPAASNSASPVQGIKNPRPQSLEKSPDRPVPLTRNETQATSTYAPGQNGPELSNEG